MAITYNNDRVNYWHGANTTSEGGSFTTSGTNRMLLVTIVEYASNNCSGVTYNGVALTKINGIAADGGRYLTTWYLLNPALGTYTVTASFNTSVYGPTVYCDSFSGVKQIGGYDTSTTSSGTGTTISGTLTPTATAKLLLVWRDNTGQTATAGTGTTVFVANQGILASTNTVSGSNTISATVASSMSWYAITFSVYEATAVSTTNKGFFALRRRA